MPEKKAAKAGMDGRIPVSDYLKKYDPYVRTLFREVLRVARSVAGEIEQRAYPGWGLHVISDRGEIVLSGFPAHVNVRFRVSDRLRDPSGHLRGSGPTTRHVRVTSIADAGSRGLRELRGSSCHRTLAIAAGSACGSRSRTGR